MKQIDDAWTSERLLAEISLMQAKAASMKPSLERQVLMARTSRLRALARARKWLNPPTLDANAGRPGKQRQ